MKSKIYIITFIFLFCKVVIGGNIALGVNVTSKWIDIYGNITFVGADAPVGTIIEVYDPRGVLCGKFQTDDEGQYGFIHVYGDDDGSGLEEGFVAGDTIIYKINGYEAIPNGPDEPIWSSDGDRLNINLIRLDIPPVVANPIPDVTVNEDAANTTINLSDVFTDPDNDDSNIIKSVQSNSDSSLVSAIIITDSLTLNYKYNQNGSSEIVIRATSNEKTVDDTFRVVVNAVDDTLEVSYVVSEGWNLLSVPLEVEFSNPKSIFDQYIDPFYTQSSYSNIYSWSEENMIYEVPTSIKVGNGFWLKSWNDSTVIEAVGSPYFGSSKTFNLSKRSGLYWQTGWHMIGNPFLVQVDFEYAVLDSVDNVYYKWDPETKSYTFYPGGGRDQYIQPWEAVWVHAKEEGASISLFNSFSGKKTAPKEFEPLWEAQLIVSTDTYKDDKNYFGVSPSASNGFDDIPIDIPEVNLPLAPGMTDFVNLSFYHDNWNEYSGKYARDIINDNPGSINWNIIITTTDTVGNATITSDNIFAIPEEYEVFLYDLEKKHLLHDFRSFPYYTFSLSSMNKIVSENLNIFLPGISDDPKYFSRFLLVLEKPSVIPEHFYISQNYPNPFNNSTNIQFGIPYPTHIKAEVYNLLGQKIETLFDEYRDAGYYTESFDALRYSSGIYFWILESKDYRHVIKMAIIK